MMQTEICPLCECRDSTFFHRDFMRPYFRCPTCTLVFVPAAYHLSAEDEKHRYDQHENDPADIRYRQFLERLSAPLIPLLQPGAKGLDFGCGPAPVLSLILAEQGFAVENYDLYYARHPELLKKRYDFLTCSETAEHFRRPRKEWELLHSLVRPGGILALMTARIEDNIDFARWRYKDDDTHLAFYSRPTLSWIAAHFGMSVEFIGFSVALFRV